MIKPKRYASSSLLCCTMLTTPAAALRHELVQPKELTRSGAKVLLVYDMEGLTDVTTGGTTLGSDRYANARLSLVADVNAAIEGLLQAGVREVVLTDGHGSGNPEPDYPVERLPAGARHEIRERPYDPYLAVLDDDYSAVVAIGMHSGSGGDGFLAHTVLAHTRWIANRFEMNEPMILAALAAQSGIPLILVTGDDVLKREVERYLQKTKYVIVKIAKSYNSAEARPRAEVSNDIKLAASDAVRELGTIPPWRALTDRSIDNEFGYRTQAQTQLASLYPHATVLHDKAVGLRTDDLLDGYLTFRALASYTFNAHMRWIVETIYELEDGDEILRRIGERMPPSAERTFAPTQNPLGSSDFANHGSK